MGDRRLSSNARHLSNGTGLGHLVLFFLLGFSTLHAQTLGVSPNPVILVMAATGPLAAAQTLSINASGLASSVNWTATVSADAPWISLSAAKGTTPAKVSLSLVDWRAGAQPPGSYSGKIQFAADGMTPVTVDVAWTVVPPPPPPHFSYLSGPQGCTQVNGYPDPAVCAVPDEKPPGGFNPPPPGGSYVDPNFGGTVNVITGTAVTHTYSANNPLSASNKYLMAFNTSAGNLDVVEVATGKVLFPKVGSSQDFFWDSYNDSIFYYPKGAAFIKHDLGSGQESTIVDYAKDGHTFTSIKRGGTTGSSKDNWISFFAPTEMQVCALDLSAIQTYCADYKSAPGIPYGAIDYTLDSKGVDKTSGKRYTILVAGGAPPGIYSVNLKTGNLDLEFRGPEDPDGNGNHDGNCDPGEKCMYPSHSDTLEDSSGIQYLVFDNFSNNPCEVSTATYQLNKGLAITQPVELGGGKRKVMSLWQCPFPNNNGGTDEHIGCAKNAPLCVISTVSPYRSATDPPLRFPHATEIIVMRENGIEVRRLAESRSVRFTDEGSEAYWAEPRAALSNDGSLVIADSNFGVEASARVTLIATGMGKPQFTVLNAASQWPALAPGSYATLNGNGLANCTASADSANLPDTLCGAKVAFNGLPAKLAYASPRQINLLVPGSLPAKADVTVSVSVGNVDGALQSVVPADTFAEAAPAIFSYSLDDGVSRAVAQNATGVLNGPGLNGSTASPAGLGETQVLYANALGPVDQTVADGNPAPVQPLARTLRTVEVYVNGTPQTVQFSGLTPGIAALYQVNFVLNPATPVMPEGSNFVWLRVNGAESRHLVISLKGSVPGN